MEKIKQTKCIIFDYDGTLADTFNMNYKILKEFFNQQGIKNFDKEKFIWIGTKNAYDRLREMGLNSRQLK